MSSFSDTNDASNTALEWLAFRYVAGELSAAEADQFELRLAVDQAAREAVAEAVAIAECVVLNPPLPVHAADRLPLVIWMPVENHPVPAPSAARADRRRERLRSTTWIGLSVAACLVLVLAVVVPTRTGVEPAGTSSATPSRLGNQAAEIAMIWAAEREADGDAELDADDLEAGEQDAAGNSTDDVPQWLLAAVSARDVSHGEGIDPEHEMLEE